MTEVIKKKNIWRKTSMKRSKNAIERKTKIEKRNKKNQE